MYSWQCIADNIGIMFLVMVIGWEHTYVYGMYSNNDDLLWINDKKGKLSLKMEDKWRKS